MSEEEQDTLDKVTAADIEQQYIDLMRKLGKAVDIEIPKTLDKKTKDRLELEIQLALAKSFVQMGQSLHEFVVALPVMMNQAIKEMARLVEEGKFQPVINVAGGNGPGRQQNGNGMSKSQKDYMNNLLNHLKMTFEQAQTAFDGQQATDNRGNLVTYLATKVYASMDDMPRKVASNLLTVLTERAGWGKRR